MKKAVAVILALLLTLYGCGADISTAIEDPGALTWWCENKYTHVKNTGDSSVYSALMEETGVDVRFIHPPKGEHRERFLTLLTGGTLPDIITHDFINDYPGGVEKALDDGVIIALNDLITNSCPYLEQYLEENPDIKEMISTKDGRIFCFPSVQTERGIRTYLGPYIRKDYLDALELDAPTTVDEWYAVMTAFKEKLGITPLSFYGGKIFDTDFLIGAYGVSWNFYIEDGTVKFGPLEDGFSDFILELKKWFDSGLISLGVFTDAQSAYAAKAERGGVGIYVDYISSISVYTDKIEGAEFTPLAYPVLSMGETAFSGHITPVFVPYSSCYISRDNKDLEATARLLDYAYSDAGSLLFNFGIEGESYELDDGFPQYTKSMLSDPDGFSNAVKRYLASGAFIRDADQFEQMLLLDCQKEAVAVWSETQAEAHALPIIALDAGQSETVSAFNAVYKDVLLDWLKDYFLSGSHETVDDLRVMLRLLGADDVLSVYQEAVDET